MLFQLPSLNVKAEKLAAWTPGSALTRSSICLKIALRRGSSPL